MSNGYRYVIETHKLSTGLPAALLPALLYPDRRCKKAERFAQAVLDVSLVRKVQPCARPARGRKQHKRRGAHRRLRHIEHADGVARRRRGARLCAAGERK
jgi:hypothetical protein